MAAIVTHAPIVDRSRIIGAYGPADRTLRRRRRPRRRVLRHAPQIGAREIDVLGATISDRTQGTGCQAAHARPDEQARGARGGPGRDLRRARDGGENRHPDRHLGPTRCPTRHGASTSSAAAEPATDKRDKKDKRDKEKRGQTGASWQLAAGELPGDEGDDIAKKPSAAIAIAQYAVLVVGLVMVLIGVVVMVANSHVT